MLVDGDAHATPKFLDSTLGNPGYRNVTLRSLIFNSAIPRSLAWLIEPDLLVLLEWLTFPNIRSFASPPGVLVMKVNERSQASKW